MKKSKNTKLVLLSIFLLIIFSTKISYANNTSQDNSVSDNKVENATQVQNVTSKETNKTKSIKDGWYKNNQYYYKNRIAVKGFKKIKGKQYYFNEKTGKKVTGLRKIKGSYYYFNKKGVMKTGWKKINKKKYYFYPTKKNHGKAATRIVKIKGKTYQFKSNGKLIGEIDKMTFKANKYSSSTKYLILVNKKKHKVGIYKGKKGNWKRIKYYDCTIGASSTPTPSGKFTMGAMNGLPAHLKYFDSGKIRCWYASRIYRGYHFHSVLYTQYKRPTTIANGRLGANLSHGCIRLKINNAKWIYNHIPSKTKCVIY